MMDERHLAFLIADVSDKGVPAALFMMSAKDLINYRASLGGTPGEILMAVNNQLARDNKNLMFVTIWMGILNLDSGEVTFACAGHEPQAVIAEDGNVVMWENHDYNPAIGLFTGMKFIDYNTRLKAGESIFLYTDGVVEAMSGSEKFYGRERMIDTLSRTGGKDPEATVLSVRSDIESFVGEAVQFDDLTMVCVKYYGTEGKG